MATINELVTEIIENIINKSVDTCRIASMDEEVIGDTVAKLLDAVYIMEDDGDGGDVTAVLQDSSDQTPGTIYRAGW